MKILNIDKEEIATTLYSIEIEFEGKKFSCNFENWNHELTEEEILKIVEDPNGPYLHRKVG
jgi:hypothetical protein